MTIVTAGPAKWTWSEDVLAFAREVGVEQYLDPLMQETRAQFPDAREMRIDVKEDPEVADLTAIVWEIDLHLPDLGDYLVLDQRLTDAFFRIVPADRAIAISQLLIPVK